MIDLRPEDGKIILNFTLLPLDFFFQDVDIFLFVAQQKYEIVGKDIDVIGHEVRQLRHVTTCH